jgi:hypothetical protein
MSPLMLLVLAIIHIALVMFERWRIDLAALFIIVVLGLAQYYGLGILSTPRTPSTSSR